MLHIKDGTFTSKLHGSLVTVVAEAVPSDFSILKSKKKSIKLTKLNARYFTYCYNLGYNTTVRARGNSDSNVANHVNQLDFIVRFIRRVIVRKYSCFFSVIIMY